MEVDRGTYRRAYRRLEYHSPPNPSHRCEEYDGAEDEQPDGVLYKIAQANLP